MINDFQQLSFMTQITISKKSYFSYTASYTDFFTFKYYFLYILESYYFKIHAIS